MHIRSIAIQNYKSLRGVRFAPGDFSVVVGANAAGKSNLADAIDFLSEIYRHGLEVAVARKGGFENIAFRRMRRSKGAIEFQLVIEVSPDELPSFLQSGRKGETVQFTHSFALGVRTASIRAEYEVHREFFQVARKEGPGWKPVMGIERSRNGALTVTRHEPANSKSVPDWAPWLDFSEFTRLTEQKRTLPTSELFVTSIGRYTLGLYAFLTLTSGIRVFQISPSRSREFGVPIPRAELEVSGSNLPAVVDLIKREHKRPWGQILDTMRAILPSLKDIHVDYTSSRTLGLYFEEEGVGRPWSVAEVSDGTIQTLALLVALNDPRYSALVLEEPENSVHPWIIRHLVEAAKTASRKKQVIVTTHSPIVVNAVTPEQLFVMSRSRGESHLSTAVALKPGFMESWQSGGVSTFDFLDSGAVPEAIPPVDEG